MQAQSFDGSKTGEQIRRYHESCNRLVHRNSEAIKRARRWEAQGWGTVRQARERRREERRGFAGEDQLVVIDERGTLRPAEGYTGDLEQGLARYAEKFGEQPIELIEAERYRRRTAVRLVPDFARWTPPVGDAGGVMVGRGARGRRTEDRSGDRDRRGDGGR